MWRKRKHELESGKTKAENPESNMPSIFSKEWSGWLDGWIHKAMEVHAGFALIDELRTLRNAVEKATADGEFDKLTGRDASVAITARLGERLLAAETKATEALREWHKTKEPR